MLKIICNIYKLLLAMWGWERGERSKVNDTLHSVAPPNSLAQWKHDCCHMRLLVCLLLPLLLPAQGYQEAGQGGVAVQQVGDGHKIIIYIDQQSTLFFFLSWPNFLPSERWSYFADLNLFYSEWFFFIIELKNSQQKVKILKKTTGLCPSRSY